MNRLTFVEHKKSDNTLIASYTYNLGTNGQRINMVDHTGRRVDYSYDALQRLISENISDPILGNENIAYTYDRVGNRLTKRNSTSVTLYSYDINDRLVSEAGPGYLYAYGYDANGNLISRDDGLGAQLYEYDYENQLVTAKVNGKDIAYRYDADGIRIGSSINGASTQYVVDKGAPFATVLEERGSTGNLSARYVYGDRLLGQQRGANNHYYHADALNSIRALTDNTQTVTDTYTYDAFGNLLATSGSSTNPFLFAGEQFDPDLMLYYLRARHYAPGIGRFTSMDPFPGYKMNPMSFHRYLYANLDPVNVIDPSGQTPLLQKIMAISIWHIIAAIVVPSLIVVLHHAGRALYGERERQIYMEDSIVNHYISNVYGRQIFSEKVQTGIQTDYNDPDWEVTVMTNLPSEGDYKQVTFTDHEPFGQGEGFGIWHEDGCWVYLGYSALSEIEMALISLRRAGHNVDWEHFWLTNPTMQDILNRASTRVVNLSSHELGHLYGLTHENDSGTIMDGGNSTDFNNNLDWSDASRSKLDDYFMPYR
jgi:RHS repeat-associated protein